MRHRKTTAKLSRAMAARKFLLANLAVQLIIYESIVTTEAKAKQLRRVIEDLITKARTGKLHHRRRILAFLPVKNAVKKLFEVLGPRYKDRPGGYTRLIKLNARKGDGANMCKIEFV